ncbi:MAG: glucose-6-phosphate isomerase [Verrucomicrobia bacterium]|nr:glucose-6-phosphate isomerase [Verrucomicrobiota bacterium]
MKPLQLWQRYQKYLYDNDTLGLRLDISRMNFTETFLKKMQPRVKEAFKAMVALEAGDLANPPPPRGEGRMVGHYWLRAPQLAAKPDPRKRPHIPANANYCKEIEDTLLRIKKFAADVHATGQFENLLVIGIGGSALGPQFVANALTTPADKLRSFFFDNTDPDGMERTLARLDLAKTLAIVISKGGSTPETRNGMLVAADAYKRAGLDFAKHAVAITMTGSSLDKQSQSWLAQFPMWDWVGGRTSETSAVGLLPAALQGFDIDGLLKGARLMDEATRVKDFRKNPAMLLALMWFKAGDGKGKKDMVILPYKDRLEFFTRYLQQLIMESIGKERDLKGRKVNQGIAVYGNKGSTDQHAYVQQLRDGVNNFFATFIEVLKDGGNPLEVEPDATCGDYLSGFFQGTRRALYENGRESITITIRHVCPGSVGKLIALYERAVGFYAALVGINAYHQPGVQAGKKAADVVLGIQRQILNHLRANHGKFFSADAIAKAIKQPGEVETVFRICEHLAANERGVKQQAGKTVCDAAYAAA